MGFGPHYKQLMRLFLEETPILDMTHIRTMVNTIIRRKRFMITYFEAFTKMCVMCCCYRRKMCLSSATWKRYRLLDKADNMLNRKLDITELLKTVQRNQTLLSAMLAPE